MSDSRDLWMVGDLLDAMSGSHIPNYVTMVMQEVQSWLASAVSEDYVMDPADVAAGGDRPLSADLEYLFAQIEWAGTYADVLPAMKGPPRHEDAMIMSVGPIILDEGLRMLVDHAALFASDVCRRIWVVSDTWVIGDVLPYIPHIKALRERGIQLHFMLVTPWDYSEIPWNNVIGEHK
ncbi:MAG: hypothetical protein LBQ36_02340 [Synergistaceae bacterium]|nr:hypothetical protein [Synergistaceae bacterium]